MLIDTLRALFNGYGVDFAQILAQILSVLAVTFLILPLHELAHAFVAYKLGDFTAKNRGRLTFNPLASVDVLGTLSMLLFGFGWAKPVPVEPRFFKHPKRDMALVAAAGPVSNVLAGLLGALIYTGMYAFQVPANMLTGFLYEFLWYYILVNISLAVFNLVPIPPLDGSKILMMLLPDRWIQSYYRYQNIIGSVGFVLLFSGLFRGPVGALQTGLTRTILIIAEQPYRLFGLL